MKRADEILYDEDLINTVYEALRRRQPNGATRGRVGTPAEVALRFPAKRPPTSTICLSNATPGAQRFSRRGVEEWMAVFDEPLLGQSVLNRFYHRAELWETSRKCNHDHLNDLMSFKRHGEIYTNDKDADHC